MNYDLEMRNILDALGGARPRLLLHACCAPCSSSVLETLTPHFAVCIDFYNPNIAPAAEYGKRAAELRRFAGAVYGDAVPVRVSPYNDAEFYAAARGLEAEPEGGARCFACYRLRMEHAARAAREGGFDFFTTTLSVSPHKNAAKLNELGLALEREYGVRFLPSDFKKRDGFKRSTQLAAEYGLYRQNYCGCVFSRRPAP